MHFNFVIMSAPIAFGKQIQLGKKFYSMVIKMITDGIFFCSQARHNETDCSKYVFTYILKCTQDCYIPNSTV